MPKSAAKEWFKPKYFPDDRGLWAARGLHGCQRLAERIRAREKHFRYLDASQLLKHALGLATTGALFELYYLYYDVDGREAASHRAELATSGRPFRATYQAADSRTHANRARNSVVRHRTGGAGSRSSLPLPLMKALWAASDSGRYRFSCQEGR